MKDTLISWVGRVDSKKTKTISLENALEEIQSGKYEDQVERGRFSASFTFACFCASKPALTGSAASWRAASTMSLATSLKWRTF